MRDFSLNLKPVPSLAPAVRASSATGSAIDRLGFEALTFLVQTGAWTDGTHVVAFEQSDDANTWTAVPAGALVGTTPGAAAAGDANKMALVGYTGDARFVRAKVNVSGSPATGAVLGVSALLGRAHHRPVA